MNLIRQAQRAAAYETVTRALKQANGRPTDAARIIGISYQALHDWIKRLDIDPKQWRIKREG